MKLELFPYQLKFKTPFGVSGNLRALTDTVFVKLSEENICGYGEACLPPYLGETLDETVMFLNSVKDFFDEIKSTDDLENVLGDLDKFSPNCNAAKASLDIALHDLLAKKSGKNFCEFKKISFPEPSHTSFTIGISDEVTLKAKINVAKDFSVLKIKAGTKDDKNLIDFIRKHTDKPLYIDVNQGWKNELEAMRFLEWLQNKNVLIVEQPLPKHLKKEMIWLTKRSPITLIADESVKRLSDLEKMENAFHGINIKLMKSTGLNETLRMIDYCKINSLKIMLGCMAESSCGTAAMAHLASFADYIDLDAPLLYVNDPFDGMEYKSGKIILKQELGFGTTIKPAWQFNWQ